MTTKYTVYSIEKLLNGKLQVSFESTSLFAGDSGRKMQDFTTDEFARTFGYTPAVPPEPPK